MRSARRRLSLLLVMAMVLVSCMNPGMTARAEKVSETAGEKILEVPTESQTDKAETETDETDEDEPDGGATTEKSEVPVASDANADEDEPMPMSLLPPKHSYTGYLMLRDLTDEELTKVPIRTILENLYDTTWKPMEAPDVTGKKILINMYSNASPEGDRDYYYHLSDDYVEYGLDDTIDLSVAYRDSYYTLEILIGTGEQLDYEAVRYTVDVYLGNDFYAALDYHLYGENGRSIDYTSVTEKASTVTVGANVPVTEVSYYISSDDYSVEKQYRLYVRHYMSTSNRIIAEAYHMSDFVDYLNDPQQGLDITKKIDMLGTYSSSSTAGLTDQFAPVDEKDALAANNFFCIVYRDMNSDAVIGYEGIIFTVLSGETSLPKGSVYNLEDGSMVDIVRRADASGGNSNTGRSLDLTKKPNGMEIDYRDSTVPFHAYYYLKSGYSSAEYYYVMDESEAANISKVVEGSFRTLEQVEKATDITALVLPSDRSKVPYGYKIDLSDERSKRFTVVYKDGSIKYYYLYVYPDTSSSGSNVPYSSDPVMNRQDPWFHVDGVVGRSSYHVENDPDQTIDTLYGYGYQTVIVQKSSSSYGQDEFDLKKVKLIFGKADNVKIQIGDKELISRETELDFSNGPVLITAFFPDDGNRKSYYVTVKEQSTNGPELFVNYPDQHPDNGEEPVRELFLTEYFENRHDILIANIGDEDITDLKVELSEDAQNVVLDDYWTINETANTLRASSYMNSTGDNFNLAKIRLLPDPNSKGGEISGTLTISSANANKEVVIKLTGYAGNPVIVTDQLVDAVKYVPYSYIIATDNMYDWNKVTFELEEGRLPAGVTLYENSGEIYGVPREEGTFPVTIVANFERTNPAGDGFSVAKFAPARKDLVLTVKSNTNANVYTSSDEGYILEEHIGTDLGNYDFLLSDYIDQTFVSSGVIEEFVDVWLNGERLIDGTDYTKESGSTRITVKSQTFRTRAKTDTINTIAAEFRTKTSVSNGSQNQGSGTDRVNDLKRTAQNFRMKGSQPEGSTGSTDSDKKPESTNTQKNDNVQEQQIQQPTVPPDDSWTQDANGWRHPLPDGSFATNSWQKLTYHGVTEWYRFGADGYMVTGWFIDTDGRTYYLNQPGEGTSGAMAVGWKQINGEWYYFLKASEGVEGSLAPSGWYYLDYNGISAWYYINSRQAMATGWVDVGGQRYYLNPVSNGFMGRMMTGWQQIDGRWYYFNEQSDGTRGAMATNKTIGDYYVGSDGARVQ